MLESMENGKTVREAGGADIDPAIDALRYYAGRVRKIYSEPIPVDGPFLNYTLREPAGVVGGIVPGTIRCRSPPGKWRRPPALAASNNELRDVDAQTASFFCQALVIC